MSGRLDGKVCLVTGAANGIGRAVAVRLANEGARVACADLTAPGETVALIEGQGGTALGYELDVTDAAALERAVADIDAAWGRIDGLHANAGIPGAGSVVTATEEHWARVLEVNLTGVFLTMKAVAPVMIRQKSGSIVVQSSVAAFMGFEDAAPYAASKGGSMALARQAAVDLGPHNIRVNALAPGMVPTGFLDQTIELRGGAAGVSGASREQIIEATAQRGLLKRVGEVEDIAALVAFLLSDDSRWITGTTMTADGGLSAR